jgi:hypothetical protein
MSGIDWNKQPSWAKHAGVDVACGHPVVWSDECHQYEGRDAILCGPPKVSFYRIASRPDPWTGTGMPPVGEKCEARIPHHTASGLQMLWCEVEVLAHAIIKGCHQSWVKEPGADGGFYAPMALTFRPIRTPEQIAAEERAQEIRRIHQVIYLMTDEQAANAIYDAGYRKHPDNG